MQTACRFLRCFKQILPTGLKTVKRSGAFLFWGVIKNGSCGLFFGDCIFEVSSARVISFDDFKRTTKHEYASHKVHNRVEVLESVGRPPEELSLTIILMEALGVDPAEEAGRLRDMCAAGEPNFLIIGDEAIGDCLFVIEEISEDVQTWSPFGKIMNSKLSLKLKEYVEHVDPEQSD